MGHASPWTDEVDETARSSWVTGISALNIAVFIHQRHGVKMSRNAVIGRATRKKWKTPNKPMELSGAAKPRRNRTKTRANGIDGALAVRIAASQQPRFPKDDRPLTADTTESRNMEMLDLGPHDCRYPTGENGHGRHLFCGHTQAEGFQYCAAHCRISYRPTPQMMADLPHGKTYSEHAGSSC